MSKAVSLLALQAVEAQLRAKSARKSDTVLLLKILKILPVTIADLQQAQIGRLVTSLHKHPEKQVQQLAQQIKERWLPLLRGGDGATCQRDGTTVQQNGDKASTRARAKQALAQALQHTECTDGHRERVAHQLEEALYSHALAQPLGKPEQRQHYQDRLSVVVQALQSNGVLCALLVLQVVSGSSLWAMEAPVLASLQLPVLCGQLSTGEGSSSSSGQASGVGHGRRCKGIANTTGIGGSRQHKVLKIMSEEEEEEDRVQGGGSDGEGEDGEGDKVESATNSSEDGSEDSGEDSSEVNSDGKARAGVSHRLTLDHRMQLLGELRAKRLRSSSHSVLVKRGTAEPQQAVLPHHPLEPVAAAGDGWDGGGARSAVIAGLDTVVLFLAYLSPAVWCSVSAVCQDWREAAGDSLLWALAYKQRWGVPVAPGQCAHTAYRHRQLGESARMTHRLCRGVRKGLVAAVLRMLDWGMELDCRDKDGLPLLHLALKHNRVHMAVKLMERGADVHQPTTEGDTPLHLAAQVGSVEAAREVLFHGGSALEVDAANKFHHTPLHLAVQEGHLAAARLLVEAGADATARFDGFTVMDLAEESNNRHLYRFLKRTYDAQRLERRQVLAPNKYAQDTMCVHRCRDLISMCRYNTMCHNMKLRSERLQHRRAERARKRQRGSRSSRGMSEERGEGADRHGARQQAPDQEDHEASNVLRPGTRRRSFERCMAGMQAEVQKLPPLPAGGDEDDDASYSGGSGEEDDEEEEEEGQESE